MFRNTFGSDVDVSSARIVRGGILVGTSAGVRYHRTLPMFSSAPSTAPPASSSTIHQLHVPPSSAASSSAPAVTLYEGIPGTATTAVAAKSALTHIVGGADNGSVRVWDGATAAQVRTFANCHRAAVTAVEYHPFGEFLVTGSRDTHVRVWDFRKKSCLQAYKTTGAGAVEALRFSPDGRWVASGCANGTLRIFDLVKGELMKEIPMAAVGGGNATGAAPTSSPSPPSSISAIISSLAFHPLRCEIAVASAGGSLSVWDCLTFTPLFTTVQPGCTVAGFVNAACLAFTGSHSRHVHLYTEGGTHHEALDRVAPTAPSSSGVSLDASFQLRDLRGGSLGESSVNVADSTSASAIVAAAGAADPSHALVPLKAPLLQLAYTAGRSVVLTQLSVPARFADGNAVVAASRPASRTTSSRPTSSSAITSNITPSSPAPLSTSPIPAAAVAGAPTFETNNSPTPGVLHGRRSSQPPGGAMSGLQIHIRPSSAQVTPPQSALIARAQTADSSAGGRAFAGGHNGGDLSGRETRLFAPANAAVDSRHHVHQPTSSPSTTNVSTPATAPASVVTSGPNNIPLPKQSPMPSAPISGRPPTPPPPLTAVVASGGPAAASPSSAPPISAPADDDLALLQQTISRSDTMIHRMNRRQTDLAVFRSFWPQNPERAFSHLEQVILETNDCAVAVSFLSNLHRTRIKGQLNWEHVPALLSIIATILHAYGVDAFLIAAIKAARYLNQRYRVRLEEGARGVSNGPPGKIPPVGAVEKCRLGLSRLAEIQPIVAELCAKSGALGVEAQSLVADLPVPGTNFMSGGGGSMGF